MAKKFVIKEDFGTTALAAGLGVGAWKAGKILKNAWKAKKERERAEREDTAGTDSPESAESTARPAASAEDLTKPKFDYASPESSKKLFQLYNQLINPNSQVDSSGNEIKPLVFSRMDQKDGKGYLYNLQGNNRQTDRQHFAQEYLDIVKNPESIPTSLEDALRQLRGRVMTRNEAEHGSSGSDYSEVKNSYDQVKIALKTLVSQFQKIDLPDDVVKGIVEEILHSIRTNKNSLVFTLKEARAPRPIAINISSEIAELEDDKKIQVINILKKWVRTIHNFGNTEIAIKLHKNLESLIARPKEAPATPTEAPPNLSEPKPPDSPEKKISLEDTHASSKFLEEIAGEVDTEVILKKAKNKFENKILGTLKLENGDEEIVFDYIEKNNRNEDCYVTLRIAKSNSSTTTFMLVEKNFVDQSLDPQKNEVQENIYEGLFNKFIKKQYKQSASSPYKMIGKNKFKLL